MPYQGFGNGKELFFLGRVLRDRGTGISQLDESRWRNFKKMYKRFMTWKIPDARVEASFDEVISDIDDTFVARGATRLWEMLKTTFTGNAHTRVPFPGVAAFYQALSKGLVGYENNPFFYVSSSPWNLYDFLRELMTIHDLPQGPLLLRDIGMSREHLFAGSHSKHKLVQIERVFDIIRDIPFILIGDSGQHDAEIYLQVIRDFPGRVKMVYIRDVDSTSHEKLLKIAGEFGKLGVEMMLVTDTIETALHAVSKGWVLERDIAQIEEEKMENEGMTVSQPK